MELVPNAERTVEYTVAKRMTDSVMKEIENNLLLIKFKLAYLSKERVN